MDKKEVLKQIESHMKVVQEELKKAQDLSDKHGVSFRAHFNGASATWYSHNQSEEDKAYYGTPEYTDGGWKSSDFDC